MVKFLVIAALMSVNSFGLSSVQPATAKVVIPVRSSSPTDGKQMFTSYCAPCHGRDGKGQGVFDSALPKPPTDLTRMASIHNGRFPESYVSSVLDDGGPSFRGHSSQMPAWGSVFAGLTHLSPNDKDLRIINLVRYLESIQSNQPTVRSHGREAQLAQPTKRAPHTSAAMSGEEHDKPGPLTASPANPSSPHSAPLP
jgi:mono/diheme cytochrome c family protein